MTASPKTSLNTQGAAATALMSILGCPQVSVGVPAPKPLLALAKVRHGQMTQNIYILDMFPYPSGKGLHIGHCVGYIPTDVVARYHRGLGNQVCHPMGFDSFGLPTEYYAISQGKTCEEVTQTNIARFKEQLNMLHLDLDWDREIWTSNPDYYCWTQWIFLQLYNSWFNHETCRAEPIETYWGKDPDSVRLVYKAVYEANWCEELQTTLADDEVTDGRSNRGGFPVTRKTIPSWFLRITPYKDRLKEGLENVEWANKKSQIKWLKRLHDVTFSRQRQWGEPIPISGETDTMPSIAGSNWYFFRYLDPKNDKEFCSKEAQNKWLPVDTYVGGSEHNTGHLLYARFITKVLYDLGHSTVDEPFKRIINVGLMMGEDGQKMAKSTGNAVAPDAMVAKYGIDAFRLGICFMGRFEEVKSWNEGSVKGCEKFLKKLVDLIGRVEEVEIPEQAGLVTAMSIAVGQDIQRFSFNTAVSKFMTCFNKLKKHDQISRTAMRDYLEALRPFCPHFYSQHRLDRVV